MESFPVVHETREVRRGTDRSGKHIINQYTFLRKLGEGAYSKVKLAVSKDVFYAVKVINKDLLRRRREFVLDAKGRMRVKNALQDADREIEILRKLRHENVVRLHEVINDESRDKLYLGKDYTVLDYCDKGPILDWVLPDQRFRYPGETQNKSEIDENRVRGYFRQIISGLQYRKVHSVHSNHIIHRDLKPQNILMTDSGVVKIADFGQAAVFEIDDTQEKTSGTLQFLPPECCGREKCKVSGKAADIWALGLTLYALVYRQLPFRGDNYADLFEGICSFVLDFPPEPQVSNMLKGLLGRMLDKNPATRVKMTEIMSDSWVNTQSPWSRARRPEDVLSVDIDPVLFP